MIMSYCGTANFTFEVERYKSKITGQLLSNAECETTSIGDMEYLLIPLQIEGNSYFTAGNTYGPPENCYPDEGETEILSCTDEHGCDWETLLTNYERDQILEKIAEDAQESGDLDEDEYVDNMDLD